MNKAFIVVLVALTVAATCLIAAQKESDSARELQKLLGKSSFERCGLDKLSDREQSELLPRLTSTPSQSYLELSAINYLNEQGWRQIEVLGYRDLELNSGGLSGEYLVTRFEGRVALLDPAIGADRIDPGLYWVKAEGSIRWQILNQSGKLIDFDPAD